MPKMMYNKLVRDKIPETIRANGHEPHFRALEEGERGPLLHHKLVEEAKELLKAATSNDRMQVRAELADVKEVLDALCIHHKISLQELAKMQEKKRDQKGGFEKFYFLISVEENEEGRR